MIKGSGATCINPLRNDHLTVRWKKLQNDHGIEPVDFKGLRHTFCSLLADQNVPLKPANSEPIFLIGTGMKLVEKTRQFKKDLPAVFLALRKKETPWYAKMLAALTIVYALSPIDLIPDFIPVLGYIDDILILPLMVTATIKLIPKDTFEQCRIESANLWKSGKPKKWYFAIPIILFWILIVYLIIKALL